jgi:hypothetical protein
MDALLRLLLPHARREIATFATVTPLGASMGPDGEVATLSGAAGGAEVTPSDILRSIYAELRLGADAGGLLASGVVSDVTLTDGAWPDGLRVELEHRDAAPITFVLPYRRSDDGPVWGDPVTMAGVRRTWDQPAGAT